MPGVSTTEAKAWGIGSSVRRRIYISRRASALSLHLVVLVLVGQRVSGGAAALPIYGANSAPSTTYERGALFIAGGRASEGVLA